MRGEYGFIEGRMGLGFFDDRAVGGVVEAGVEGVADGFFDEVSFGLLLGGAVVAEFFVDEGGGDGGGAFDAVDLDLEVGVFSGGGGLSVEADEFGGEDGAGVFEDVFVVEFVDEVGSFLAVVFGGAAGGRVSLEPVEVVRVRFMGEL